MRTQTSSNLSLYFNLVAMCLYGKFIVYFCYTLGQREFIIAKRFLIDETKALGFLLICFWIVIAFIVVDIEIRSWTVTIP